MLKKNKKLVATVIALVVIAGSVAIAADPVNDIVTGTWRYKITVSVDTPEGLKTGSAVREVTVIKGSVSPPEATASKVPRGEAVVVDLGKRGVLFALTSFDDYRTVFEAFPYHKGGTTHEGIRYYSALKDAKATLKPEHYPRLVTFKDLSDPKSVVSLLETSDCMRRDSNGTCIEKQFHITGNHFEEVFGEGVRLEEVTIEMTDEPVTWGIEKWLPWLPCRNQRKGYIGGSPRTPSEDPSQTHITGGSFGLAKAEESDSAACKAFWEKQEEKENAALRSEFEEWQRLASAGNSEAQFEIGNVYALGYIVPKDYMEAVKWYLKSANQGYPHAMNRLSSFYANGHGVEKDYEASLFWLRLARRFAGPVTLDEDYISKQLTTEQIASVRKRADEWKPVSQ